ncbi:MAG: hypothetical protein HY674_20050 [Chloroflexi bacterium]|nr:hypothetical protein [Chloroflexota bacterium]
MSATELIKQVASLPPQERTLFEQLFHALENGTRTSDLASQPKWPEFGERLRRIYGERVAPDSQSIIHDGRGDR